MSGFGCGASYDARMRLKLAIVLSSVLLAAACSSGPPSAPEGYEPKVGQVLAVSDGGGSVVISLGTRDGIRPGDSLLVVRDGREVGEIIIHEAKATQAVGTTVGGAGDVAPGDAVIGR